MRGRVEKCKVIGNVIRLILRDVALVSWTFNKRIIIQKPCAMSSQLLIIYEGVGIPWPISSP